MTGSAIRYTPAMLARLTYSDAAHELAEQLVSAAATYADGYGCGAFLSEEAATMLSGGTALLEAAVVADRLRGASWTDVGAALDLSAEEAEGRFGAGERTFRESVLFPHRAGPRGGLGYIAAPHAVEEPDRVRERLDAWVVERQGSSGPRRDEPEPVTRGLAGMERTWIAEKIGEVLELSDALITRRLPAGVSYEDAELHHAQLKVELYVAMAAEQAEDDDVARQLADARARLDQLREQLPPAQG